MPGRDDLKGVDELRVEPRGDFNAHARWEEHEIKPSQVRLLEPEDLVLICQLLEDRDAGTFLAVMKLDFRIWCHGGHYTILFEASRDRFAVLSLGTKVVAGFGGRTRRTLLNKQYSRGD